MSISRLLATAGMLACIASTSAQTQTRQMYWHDGSTVSLGVSDSIISIQFIAGILPTVTNSFASERPELDDAYNVWGVGSGIYVFAIEYRLLMGLRARRGG